MVVGVAPAAVVCGFRAVVATWALASDVLASSGRKKRIERFESIKAKSEDITSGARTGNDRLSNAKHSQFGAESSGLASIKKAAD
jgi:hypothetical protein